MTDMIELRGLRVMGTHGVGAEELVRAQPFEVDLDVELDLSRAAATDDLAETIDYGGLSEMVATVVAGAHCDLMEALAGRIADVALADERAVAVTVWVRKLRPPVPVDLRTAGVRLRRARS